MDSSDDQVVHSFDSVYGHYEVVDLIYGDRPARVLFSGNQEAAQSGVAKDNIPELLFDYNERLLELSLELQPNRILLIGGGVYTLPMALLKGLPEACIDVVELDNALLPVARKYFDLQPNSRLEVFHNHGRAYLSSTSRRYDLVIIDAFNHTDIPVELASVEAAQSIRELLKPNGVVALNIISSYYGKNNAITRNLWAAYQDLFEHLRLSPASNDQSLWLPLNLILQASDNRASLASLRYAALPAITDVTVLDALRD
ncbi:fused MFS/spermidine synthase [Candidatus Saccharibacteria bacterium]|nr:fused MFS/spermidine synthase [Candidatus Saccharibacteria bacterium]